MPKQEQLEREINNFRAAARGLVNNLDRLIFKVGFSKQAAKQLLEQDIHDLEVRKAFTETFNSTEQSLRALNVTYQDLREIFNEILIKELELSIMKGKSNE